MTHGGEPVFAYKAVESHYLPLFCRFGLTGRGGTKSPVGDVGGGVGVGVVLHPLSAHNFARPTENQQWEV